MRGRIRRGSRCSSGASAWKSYARLAADAASLARGLRGKLGLAPGDRVALVMANAPEYAEVLLGAWWAGLAAVPVNAKLHPREVAFILENSGAKAVFATPDWIAGLAEACAGLDRPPDVIEAGSVGYDALFGEPVPLEPVADDALAWLFYTSGTTGRPKGAMLSHANLRAMAQGYLTDVDAVAPRGLPAARRADVARLGPLPRALPPGGRRAGRPGVRRLRSGGGVRARGDASRRRPLRRADDRAPPGRARRSARAAARGLAHGGLRRRADVRGGPAARARRDGPALRADLRAGREPDDDHGAGQALRERPRPPAPPRAHRLRGPAAERGGGGRARRRRARPAARARWARCACAAPS